MQLHDQASETAAAAMSCAGTELFTIFQVFFFIVLGYSVTRAYMLLCPGPRKLSSKKTDDVFDELIGNQLGAACKDETLSPSRALIKARHSNAQERKRMRKVSQSEVKTTNNDDMPVATEDQAQCSPSPHVVAFQQDLVPTDEIVVCKVRSKKAERKARKAAQPPQEAAASPVSTADLSDSEARSQGSQGTMSQVPSSLSMSHLSTGVESSESDAKSDSAHSQFAGDDDYTSTAPGAQAEPLEIQCEVHHEETGLGNVESAEALGSKLSDCIPCVNFDDIESDTDSDMDEFDQPSAPCNTLAPYNVQSSHDIANAPVMWCSVPQGPSVINENAPYVMPQIDGWVAVAVPTECAPPGAFDGLWKNNADEKILIEKLEIMFESGITWGMEMHSLTNISVQVDGQTLHAELDITGQNLLWSDGDTWAFFGQVQDPPECAPCIMVEESFPESCMMMPCMMPETFAGFEDMSMLPMNQWPSPPVDNFDLCWDWAKKGQCPRGSNCEWHHPMQEACFF